MKLFAEGELYELLNAQLECMGVELLSQNLSALSPAGVDQYLASLLACYRSQPLVFDWEHAGFAKRDAPLGGDQDAAPTVTYRIPFAGAEDLLRYTARPLRWLRRHGTFVDAEGYIERAHLCFDLVARRGDPIAVQREAEQIHAFIRDEVPHINNDVHDYNNDQLPRTLHGALQEFYARLPLIAATTALLMPSEPLPSNLDSVRSTPIRIDNLSLEEVDVRLEELSMPQAARDHAVQSERDRRSQAQPSPIEPAQPLHIDDLLLGKLDQVLQAQGVSDEARSTIIQARQSKTLAKGDNST